MERVYRAGPRADDLRWPTVCGCNRDLWLVHADQCRVHSSRGTREANATTRPRTPPARNRRPPPRHCTEKPSDLLMLLSGTNWSPPRCCGVTASDCELFGRPAAPGVVRVPRRTSRPGRLLRPQSACFHQWTRPRPAGVECCRAPSRLRQAPRSHLCGQGAIRLDSATNTGQCFGERQVHRRSQVRIGSAATIHVRPKPSPDKSSRCTGPSLPSVRHGMACLEVHRRP